MSVGVKQVDGGCWFSCHGTHSIADGRVAACHSRVPKPQRCKRSGTFPRNSYPPRGVRRKDEASNSSVGLFYHTLNQSGMDVYSLTRRTRYPCSIFFQEILPTRVKAHLARFRQVREHLARFLGWLPYDSLPHLIDNLAVLPNKKSACVSRSSTKRPKRSPGCGSARHRKYPGKCICLNK